MRGPVIIGALLLAFTSGGITAAEPGPAATVSVEHAWIRLLPAGLPNAGYATIVNQGDVSVTFTGAESAAYAQVMLHHSIHTSGVQHMEMVAALRIPARGSVALAPGGYHLMLMQPTRVLHVGEQVRMVLHFADGTDVEATFEVRPANSTGG